MGEAKRRGTYEDRKAQSIAKQQLNNNHHDPITIMGEDQNPFTTSSLLMRMAMAAGGPNIHGPNFHEEPHRKMSTQEEIEMDRKEMLGDDNVIEIEKD